MTQPGTVAVIWTLKRHGRAPVPDTLRRRLATRLSASGLVSVTLGAGAVSAANASAAAPLVAMGAGAGTTVAAGSSGVSMAALAKALLLGLGLGTAAGAGLHVGFAERGPTPAPSGNASEPAVIPHVPEAPPAPPLAVQRVEVPVATTNATERSTPPRARGHRAAAADRAVPAALDSAPDRAGLSEQQALLDDARAALRRGDGAGALSAVRAHGDRFPRTAFEEEREAVATKALVLIGQRAEAERRFRAFEARFPGSLLLPSLRAVVGFGEGSSP